MAGRFAQPASAVAATRNETARTFTTRVTMSPPCGMDGVRSAPIVSRQARGPRWTRVSSAADQRGLFGAIREHREDRPAAEATGLEGQMAPVGRPRRALVVTAVGE